MREDIYSHTNFTINNNVISMVNLTLFNALYKINLDLN